MTSDKTSIGVTIFWVLALLVGCFVAVTGAQAGEAVVAESGSDGVQRAKIVMDSYSYKPDHLVVQAGKPVELILMSVTTLTPHNFVLKEPAASLEVNQDVGAGKSGTVRFTPNQPGIFKFYCDKKLLFFKSHREKGMEGRLEVR
jgi:plastocyanin